MDNKNIEEKLNELLNSFGAVVETTWFLFNSFKKKGFTEEQAMRFCLCYMKSVTTPRKHNDES